MPLPLDQLRLCRKWLIEAAKYHDKPLGLDRAKRFIGRLADHEAEFLRAHAYLFADERTLINDIAVAFVAWLSAKGRKGDAAALLWEEEQFSALPEAVRKIWETLEQENYACLIGASGQGKSYSPAVWLLLDWLSDPTGTRIDLVSTDEQKLKGALFSKIVNLHQSASIKLPGLCSAESLSLDTKAGFGFHLQLIQRGAVSSGELKGAHISARPIAHAIYGKYTRRRVMLDEAEEIPSNVWGQIPNVFASSDGSVDSVKVIATANPKNQNSLFGQHCKPKDGWASIGDNPKDWRAEKGARVIRLDVRDSENIRQNKVVFQGFQTAPGLKTLLDSCGGDENHPDMWTFAYGFFPPNGHAANLIPQRWMIACQGEWVFEQMPMPCGGFDVALEGDTPALAVGRVGRASKWRNLAGVEMHLKEPRWVIQLDTVMAIPHGDTQDVADEAMARCRSLGIDAENLAVDITGMPGVGDIMGRQWNQKVLAIPSSDPRHLETAPVVRVNYSERASSRKIAAEDAKSPEQLYDRTATELWYATARLMELDVIRIGRGVSEKTMNQLGSRRGGFSQVRGGKMTIEPKKVHKKRLSGASPDEADATTLLISAARLRCEGLAPHAPDTPGVERPPPFSAWAYEKAWGAPPPGHDANNEPANLHTTFAPTLEGLEEQHAQASDTHSVW